MLISLGFYKRAPGLSAAEFRHLWSEIYGPLYARHPEVTRYLRRYVQHRLSPNLDFPTTMIGFDGFSESWFDSVEDRQAMMREPVYLEQIKPLEARFLDLSATRVAAYDSPVYQVGAEPLLVRAEQGC